jgi:hypothetical protein
MIDPPSVKPTVLSWKAGASKVACVRSVVHAAREVVGAALGDGVDVGAGVAHLRDVVVAQVDLHALDGVDRDRLLERRQVVRLQAEGVVAGQAVDRDAVEAGVLSAGADLSALLVGLAEPRVGAGVVLQVALDRGVGVELALPARPVTVMVCVAAPSRPSSASVSARARLRSLRRSTSLPRWKTTVYGPPARRPRAA